MQARQQQVAVFRLWKLKKEMDQRGPIQLQQQLQVGDV
jgi:hypothetical protein